MDLLVRHPERFTPLKPQSVEMRTLICLVEQRRNLVNDKTRITNRLRSALKQYYPQMLEWFRHLDTVLVCDFITRWPTLKQLKRARKNTLEKFFHEHNMRFPHVLDARLKSIKAATPLTLDAAVVTPVWCKYSITPIILGIVCFVIYLAFLTSSLFWKEGWINTLFYEHYVFFVGLPFAGFLAYFIVGTL